MEIINHLKVEDLRYEFSIHCNNCRKCVSTGRNSKIYTLVGCIFEWILENYELKRKGN